MKNPPARSARPSKTAQRPKPEKKAPERKAKERAGDGRKRAKGGGGGVRPRSAAAPDQDQRRARGDLAETRELAVAAIGAALDKKALMPVLIDVSAMASYTDFIGIVSGRSDRQVDAIAEWINQLMKSRGRHVLGHEGSGSGRWTLLDYGAIVIHVFYHPVREFYDLESLWIDAPRVKLDLPPEATVIDADALYGSL